MTSVSFSVSLSQGEKEFVRANQSKTFTLGLDPYSGMDYFIMNNKPQGYINEVVELIESATGLSIEIIGNWTWGEVYDGLIEGDIDILFGANATEERKQFMSFTSPIHQYPYAVFYNETIDIQTLGDFDGKAIGFIEGDMIIQRFSEDYPLINFKVKEYASQKEALEALNQGNDIQGFITSGGGIVYDFLFTYKNIELMTQLESITSDMTLSTLKENEVLISIIEKVLSNPNYRNQIDGMIADAEVQYNRKILNLSDLELYWLENHEPVIVGAPNDYLPFDYTSQGKYLGIAGKVFEDIASITGIRYEVVSGNFDELYDQALRSEIDVLNMAKTSVRMNLFDFPKSFSQERDQIFGHQDKKSLSSLYELDGKRVAVINGFWHEELLKKNLKNPEIIYTTSIQETLKLIDAGRVEYFIENPTVAEYYIEQLEYENIVKKGVVAKDSFLYFGVNRDEKELSSIIDKSIELINYNELKSEGLKTVPSLTSPRDERIKLTILLMILLIVGIIVIVIRLFKALVEKEAETKLLKEKEKLYQKDFLTGVYNRNYFKRIIKDLDSLLYPQGVIITDINGLKEANDQYGHLFGDALLVTYAELLKKHFNQWTIIRMGGDEFLLFKSNITKDLIEKKIKIINGELKKTVVRYDNNEIIGLTAAFGYAIRSNLEISVNQLYQQADEAMYENKRVLKSERMSHENQTN